MPKLLSLILSLLLFFCPSFANQKEIPFDKVAALGYIKILASDAMEGRKSGTPGGKMAEEFIAQKFQEWGVVAAGENGTYFQNFKATFQHVYPGGELKIIADHKEREFSYGDWSAWRYSGSGDFKAEIVFAGHGIHAPEKGYSDYKNMDVRGKLVLIEMSYIPKHKNFLKEEIKLPQRIEAAQNLGARGVMLFRSMFNRSYDRTIGSLKKENHRPDFVILMADNKITQFIFKNLKTDLRYLLQEIDTHEKPMPYATGVKASVSVKAILDENRPMRNVFGMLPGTDPGLKDEYVIVGGHLDHIGIDPYGDINNGANDNASGTAVTMELARILTQSQIKPKRTIIFALWAGEEQNVLGSSHYAHHPLYPLEKTLAYLNLDMVGHGNGNLELHNIYYGPDIAELMQSKLPKKWMDITTFNREYYSGNSDHAPFLEQGVPGYYIRTAGYHFKYHKSRDDTDLIQSDLLAKTGEFVKAALDILANELGNWIPPFRRETYYLKEMKLIDYTLLPLSEAVEKISETKDTLVDLQFAVIEEKKELSGDPLRADIINNLISIGERTSKSQGLSLFSTPQKFRSDIYSKGKTTIIPGLKGIRSIQDAPQWAKVLAKQGLYFVYLDNTQHLFSNGTLTEQAKNSIEEIHEAGLVLILSDFNSSQIKEFMKISNQPLLIIKKQVPSSEELELIKENNAVLGLFLLPDEDPEAYFKRLDKAKDLFGRETVSIINGQSLWEKSGQDQLIGVTSHILKAGYEWYDIVYPFSRSFLTLLETIRGGA